MSTLLHPKMATCPHCVGWEVPCSSDAERRRTIDNHNRGKHATAEAVTELLYDDPSHTADREAVEQAIRTVARYYNGVVDPNKVRSQVPSWVNPRVTAAVYGAWTRRGLLVPIGKARSTDSKSRNTNKDATIYRLRGAS